MNSAFLFQCLWTMENTPEKLENVLKEVFSDYCDFNDVMEIFKKCDNNINWKYLLTVIAACAKHSKASQKQLQKTVHDNLLSMFKGGKISDFKTAILLIRQATLEKQMDLKYDIWFSNTFGVNTTFITAENQTIFKFFVDCLHNVVSLESEAFLEIHINRAIRAPPKCNALMLEYKNICKSRLKQLKKYPSIVLNNEKLNVLQMFENTYRIKRVDPIIKQIMKEDYQSFYDKFVPYLNNESVVFKNVKEIFLSEKLVSIDLLNHCKSVEELTVISDDDDEELLINKC
ncbi:uncharacterized protein LOC108739600 isoform X4 [Agrilus planipennis]|nr:uncharacterized protein LOC108739600 isoform X4 [Agrilus planipennis]